MNWPESPLLTDLYQLNMIEAYLDHSMTETAVFEFFVRKLPQKRQFLIAAGLEQAVEFLENVRFSHEDLTWLEKTGRFTTRFLDYLAAFRFTGDVDALPEGTPVFANEPLLRLAAPLPQAQFAETALINILHFQTLIASKAARLVLLAPDKRLIDFGLRRAHGGEAGLLAARACYLAGFAGTATVEAGRRFGIPIYGTMAHSFVQTFESETAAFAAFARSRPQNLILLIDTYDTEAAARKVVALAPRLAAEGVIIAGVRLDSGDLVSLSRRVRQILDAGGLSQTTIFASGGIDEEELARFQAEGAPIDGFGIGTSVTTSFDVPALDCAYKLQEYAGIARRKQSTGKATWPGRKQVWRRYASDGRLAGDTLSLEGATLEGMPLLVPILRSGRRVAPAPSLEDIRARTAEALARLPDPMRRLDPAASYPVTVDKALQDLALAVDRRLAAGGRTPNETTITPAPAADGKRAP